MRPHNFIHEREAEIAREQLRAGICPYCARGPFRTIASHTWQVHEMSGRQLRDEFGFYFDEPLCDPDSSARRREIALKHVIWENTDPAMPRQKRGLSKKAIARLAEIGFKRGHPPTRFKTIKHGTRTEYVRGCRCPSCKQANSISSAYYRRLAIATRHKVS